MLVRCVYLSHSSVSKVMISNIEIFITHLKLKIDVEIAVKNY